MGVRCEYTVEEIEQEIDRLKAELKYYEEKLKDIQTDR